MTISRLTTTTALARAWRNVTHGTELRHSVWLMLLDAGHRPVQPVIELEDAESPPDPGDLAPLVDFLTELTHLSSGACRVAVLRSRPGRGLPSADDRAWAAVLRRAAGAAGLPCLGVHFVNDEHLVALTSPDPLPASRDLPDARRGA